MFRMTASHAQWPIESDPIFAISSRAKEAINKFGKENVINATLGAIADDDGNLVTLTTVFDELKQLPNSAIAEYSPIAGQAEYLEKAENMCFSQYRPNAFIKSVATPGGTGALRNAIYNYSNQGDDILVADWFWSPYRTIAEENQRGLQTFRLFDDNGNFDLVDFEKNFNEILAKQKRIVAILNTPAHNPTGYSIEDNEWDKIIEILKKASNYKENKIVLVVDTAYIDYAGEGDSRRTFFSKFSNLPENVLVLVAFSLSKSHTMYGLRMGALIAITSNEDVATDFYYSNSHSCRATWSTLNSSAMKTMIRIENDSEKKAEYIKERSYWKNVLQARARAFVKASEEVNLVTLPYRDGFFTTIPYDDPTLLVDKLAEKNLFAVPLKKGVRFAICAVSEQKCAICPKIIKETIDEIAQNK